MPELLIKEKLFCKYLSEFNDRTEAVKMAGYCKYIFDREDKELTKKDKHAIAQQAYRLLKRQDIKDELSRLADERLTYVKENGVSDVIDVLKWLSDVMTGKTRENNPFHMQCRISAAKELLNYYKDCNKFNYKQKESKLNAIEEKKEFFITYVEEEKEKEKEEVMIS